MVGGIFTKRKYRGHLFGGVGGQFIFIMPEIKTVVVMTGSNYPTPYNDMINIIDRYILGSIIK